MLMIIIRPISIIHKRVTPNVMHNIYNVNDLHGTKLFQPELFQYSADT